MFGKKKFLGIEFEARGVLKRRESLARRSFEQVVVDNRINLLYPVNRASKRLRR